MKCVFWYIPNKNWKVMDTNKNSWFFVVTHSQCEWEIEDVLILNMCLEINVNRETKRTQEFNIPKNQGFDTSRAQTFKIPKAYVFKIPSSLGLNPLRPQSLKSLRCQGFMEDIKEH